LEKVVFLPKNESKMRITALQLQNFKRFTDLQIQNIPAEAKLVLLIGANGSGKSCVFDAFDWFVKENYSGQQQDNTLKSQGDDFILNNVYYAKNNASTVSTTILFDKIGKQSKTIPRQGIENKRKLPKNIFFGRPSMRIVPRLANLPFDERAVLDNTDGPEHFIDFDTRFQSDVKKYTWDVNKALRDPLFAGDVTIDLRAIMQQFITPVNSALERIFGRDMKTSIRIANYQEAGNTVVEPPRLIFSKGGSFINYDLLSHGEKQIIIILLNFIVRSPYFQDTIYYIDEMDVHLNTTLQYALLKEITENWIPENCQLWTATHSLGFIEYAKDEDHAAIIDFDNLNFDETQIIEPSPKYNEDIFEIAIPRASLAKILGNRKVVLCENKNYLPYSLMGLDDFIFTDVENSNSVFLKIKRDKTLLGLRDRDFLTDSEIQQLENAFPNFKILRYYCFENYVYHPENIAALGLEGFDETVYRNEIIQVKNDLVKGKIIPNLVAARNGYEEFKAGGVKKDSDLTLMTLALESDDFETFYPYFNAKLHGATLRHKYKLDKNGMEYKLVQTEWFKGRLTDILK
jgi:predicted ATPase